MGLTPGRWLLLAGLAVWGCDDGVARLDGGALDAPTSDSVTQPGLDGASADLDAGAARDAAADGARHGDATADAPTVADGAALPDRWVVPVDGPLWLLHISDTHLGGNLTTAKPTLEAFVTQVLPVVAPYATLHSGDATERGGAWEWRLYREAIEGQVPAYPAYLEIPGNHDMKASTDTFSAYSQTGQAGGGLFGVTRLQRGGAGLTVVRTNTADTGFNPTNIAGLFGEAQAQALLAEDPGDDPVVVMGHHPIVGVDGLQSLGSDARMEQVLRHFGAALYLCGHIHGFELSWLGPTLLVQAATLGSPSDLHAERSFVLLGLDSQGPSARKVAIDHLQQPHAVGWPLVLITLPADAALAGANPHAPPLAAARPTLVRALAFAPSPITSVTCQIGGAAPVAMGHGGGPLWELEVELPQQPGAAQLRVQASSAEGQAEHLISLSVQ